MTLIPAGDNWLAQNNSLFDRAVQDTLDTVSESSQRTYQHAYDKWADWCHNQGCSPLEFSYIKDFLIDQPVSYRTRKTTLSAIRQLITTIELMRPNEQQWAIYSGMIHRMKAPKQGCVTNEQLKVALTPEQAWKVLGCWDGVDVMNHALICTAVLSGLRRAELLDLRWHDIDLERSVITVRHGKGDKHREASLFGNQAHRALQQWNVLNPGESVFPISQSTVWRIFKRTAKRCGLEKFSPHDARRTLLTEMLATGQPVHEAQAQAGHEQGDTTLRYAKATDAEKRKKDTKLRFGE